MIIVADTSAFMAILQNEQDALAFRRVLLEADKVLLSAATAIELYIVVVNRLLAKSLECYRFGSPA